jgi:gamma-glutamylcyclotransferase (GGCT)/AIG2-like uncharacterized protein YtfP
MKEYLFSYGTLQNEELQLEIFGRVLNGKKDSLKGYKLSSVEVKDPSFLSKNDEKYHQNAILSIGSDFIKGTVFEISKEELLLSDRYEPDYYKRIEVTLQTGKVAWMYVAV